MRVSKFDPVSVWNVPKDGSIKDYPPSDFLKTYRFAKWYLMYTDANNSFFLDLIEIVDLVILSLRLSPSAKLVLDANILEREFCDEEVKPISIHILDLNISRNTYFKHRDIAISFAEKFIQDYLNSLD